MNFSLAVVLLAIAATVAYSQNVPILADASIAQAAQFQQKADLPATEAPNTTKGPCCLDAVFAVAPNMMKVRASTVPPLASSDFRSLVLNSTDNGEHLGNIQDALASGMNVSDAVARLLMASQNATTTVPLN